MKACNDLCSLVYQKLVEQNIISVQEKILLNPYHIINLHENGILTILSIAYILIKNFFLKYRKVMIHHHTVTIICEFSAMKLENIYIHLF